jgi:hypothetical protein
MEKKTQSKGISLREVSIKFSTDEQCLEYIEKMRWPDGIVRCPICGDTNIERYERPATEPKRRSKTRKPEKGNVRHWFYICRNADCRQQFSPTAGTLFHDTHLPLIVWFQAVALMLNAKKGLSAKQLQRDLGIGGYKTAWYLCHRIRESMQEANPQPLGGIVEIDETYMGGKVRGQGVKLAKAKKKVVMGAVQRGGEVRFRHVPDTKIDTISGFVKAHLSTEVERVMTDQMGVYPTVLAPEFTGRHERVNHIIGEYVRGDVTTNSIESAFSLLKRGVIGQFHKLSGKHLHRYLSEFEYRFNRRHEADPFIETLRRLCGFKPLPFATLTSDEV